MFKLLLLTIVVLIPFVTHAEEISDFDIATYSLIKKDGRSTGMLMRLSKVSDKWVMEGKEKGSNSPWKNISCDTGCEYKASTKIEHKTYLALFPTITQKQFNISCIQNIASAFCRLTKKDNPSKGGYTLIALVTEKPVPLSLRRLTKPYPSKRK